MEIKKIFKSKKFHSALIIVICFNLFYCWFMNSYWNKSVESTKQYIADIEKDIKELEQKLKKEKNAKIRNLYQEQIYDLNRIVQKEKLRLQYSTNLKKEMEKRAQILQDDV